MACSLVYINCCPHSFSRNDTFPNPYTYAHIDKVIIKNVIKPTGLIKMIRIKADINTFREYICRKLE